MNIISKQPLTSLGYNFIVAPYLPEGKNEYYLREIQKGNTNSYRKLTAVEKEGLILNGNSSDNWDNVLVSEQFIVSLIKRSKFYGLVRIGNMEPISLSFHSFKMSVGIYDSTIISSDLGDNVCISNVQYLSHYIIGNEVMIANVNELATTDTAKFGNGIVKEGEDTATRVWMELCNENGGRPVIPFNRMLPGDAYMWSKYRDDEMLMEKFIQLTEKEFDNKRGYYGTIGDRTVIKNCKIIKDVKIGSDAYLKGANKLKNLTINSDGNRTSQIGEGVELVNGIIGFGCRIFYGVKAVRFAMASHSQLKYGARLINSYLGNNSTISCCEVLNSLIFPAHEQHHNNSFLCASMIMGQSNIAAGATIGSNHNSRSADGEIVAGRGFWPGLCVSLKHNSKFASFSILAKGDYPAELNIPIPFSLISNDVTHDKLVIMPGYWFMYNMYALERNSRKYVDRDKRTEKIQLMEYDYLAPDTINEIFDAIEILSAIKVDAENCFFTTGFENTSRRTQIIKLPESLKLFKDLIIYYAGTQLLNHFEQNNFKNFKEFKETLTGEISRDKWINLGGQLMRADDVEDLKKKIKTGNIRMWQEVHAFYIENGTLYPQQKLQHAYTSLLEISGITSKQFTPHTLKDVLTTTLEMKERMAKGIYDSRAKDFTGNFRKMVYETTEEMNKVLGRIEDNSFIQQQLKETDEFRIQLKSVLKKI
ncbi:DUF4954 family protein [soil metagenome]